MRDYLRHPIVERITVHAPLERCFALSTRVELVQKTLGMRLVGGVTTGHIAGQSRVIWRGWKFGLPTAHHTLITAFEPPHTMPDGAREAMFEDSQERGRFARFWHQHYLRETDGVTELEDRIHFSLPFGLAGQFVASLVLAPHIRRLARKRFAMIRTLAESTGWRAWAPEDATQL